MLSRNQSFRESRVTSSERRSAPQRSQSFSIKSRRTLPSEHSRIERSHTEQKTIRQDQPSNNVTSKMLAELNSEHHLIPNYFTMTNRVLKQKFSQVDNDVHFLRRWFDTSEKCATVRQYAQLSAHYYHATYQRELWKVYYDASLTFSVWPRTTVKEAMALHTDLNSFFFLSSAQLYAQHQEQAAHYKRRQRSLDEFERQEEYRQADQLIHLARLFEHVKRLVVHDLHRVRVTFEQKINLFHYDADDYRAVAAFYHSNPTKDQVNYLFRALLSSTLMGQQLDSIGASDLAMDSSAATGRRTYRSMQRTSALLAIRDASRSFSKNFMASSIATKNCPMETLSPGSLRRERQNGHSHVSGTH